MIDNLDVLSTKPAAQDELASNIDAMIDNDRPVIVTCSRLPERYAASKLIWPVVWRLAMPWNCLCLAQRQRAKIISLLVTSIDPLLSIDDLANLLAKLNETVYRAALAIGRHVGQPATQAVGSLDFTQLREHALSVSVANRWTSTRLPKLLQTVFIKLPELRSATRLARVVRARGLVILLTRRLTTASLQSIGEYLVGRDIRTILHAYRKLEETLLAILSSRKRCWSSNTS